MTQKTTTPSSRLRLYHVLSAQGLGWLGSIGVFTGGVLGSGVALAQSSATDLVIPETSATQPTDVVPSDVVPPDIMPASEALAPAVTVAPEAFPPESSAYPQLAPMPSGTPEVTLQSPKASDDRYEAPDAIVFSERSTGCQTVLQQGQRLAGGPCASDEPQVVAKAASGGSVSAVSVGPLSVTPVGGFSLGTTASVRNYYNRTIRPPARLGNGNIRLIFPLSIPASISSIFGWRIHPITGNQRFHSGTDLAAPLGTPVLAAFAGRVAIADFLGGYGLTVTLEHNKATQQTLYAHLSEIFVKPGELVKQGDVIGRVGSTGNSTGPHLHFEFRQSTPDGWVALDAGQQLEYAMAQLVKALAVAQKSQPAKG